MCTIGTTFKDKVGNKSKMNSDIELFKNCQKNSKIFILL